MNEAYTITNTEHIEKLKVFFLSKSREDSICLLYDDDADGLCSAISVYAGLERLGFQSIISFCKTKERGVFQKDFLQNLKTAGVDTIICVDFEPLSWQFISQDALQKLSMHVVIMDHHFDQTALYNSNSHKRIFIHPKNSGVCDDSGQYCCSKFCYDVMSHIVDISDIEWKILPGMIGDMNIIKWDKFIRAKMRQFGYRGRSHFFQTPFGKLATLFGFASAIGADEFEQEFFDYRQATSVKDALNVCDKKEFKPMWKEYKSSLKLPGTETVDGVSFVQLKTKYRLASIISSIVGYLNPDKTFFFYRFDPDEKKYAISVRTQTDSIHLGKLIQHACTGIEGARGGGHQKAAGAGCRKDDLELIKERFIENLQKFTITS